MKELTEEQVNRLIRLAKNKTSDEHSSDEIFNPYDAFGGNFDDTYYGGMNDGEIQLARDILDELKIEY